MGMCSCAGIMLLNRDAGAMDLDEPGDPVDARIQEIEWKVGFMQRRFGKMLDLLKETTDIETQAHILEGMGRACAAEYTEQIKQFQGDIDGFIKHMEEQWAEKVDYNKEKGMISVTGKKQESCFCPFVNRDHTPKEFCSCSLGWQKETFEFISGKKVEASISDTILRGSESCNFQIGLSI